MEITKKNGNVCFNEEKHIYWKEHTDKKFISVTTLIHNYQQPFDEYFWSRYKTLESIVGKEVFANYKTQILNTHKIDKNLLDELNIDEKSFIKEVELLILTWLKTKTDSCERGTAIHLEQENKFYTSEIHDIKKFDFGGKVNLTGEFKCKKNNYDLSEENGIYPEFLIYYESPDGEIKIAGQVDLIIKQGNDVYVLDYKSNKELKFKSGRDFKTKRNAMMNFPLNQFMDCNMEHYKLQLSTYAWMLQQMYPHLNIISLTIIHYDHNDNVNYYQLSYVKKEVELMINHYKKELNTEKKKEKRKRIEF